MIVELNTKNVERLKALIQQKAVAEQMLNDYITTILDTKEVDYTNKEVKVSEDLTKIIVDEAEVVQQMVD